MLLLHRTVEYDHGNGDVIKTNYTQRKQETLFGEYLMDLLFSGLFFCKTIFANLVIFHGSYSGGHAHQQVSPSSNTHQQQHIQCKVCVRVRLQRRIIYS